MVEHRNPHGSLTEEARKLLEDRARIYAATEEQSVSALLGYEYTEGMVLCVRHLAERLGLPLEAVSEVISVRNVVPVPGAPAHLLGLTRLRGRLLALVDLVRFWRHGEAGHTDCDLAVVVRHEGVELGLLCAEIEGLREVGREAVREPPSNMPSRQSASLRGVVEQDLLLVEPTLLMAQPGFVVGSRGRGGGADDRP